VENTLKHAGGTYGLVHMASKGRVLDVIKLPGAAPMGSSGIQVVMETDRMIEGTVLGRQGQQPDCARAPIEQSL